MIVKLKENPPLEKYKYGNISGLDKNTLYKVLSIEFDSYRLINEAGEPVLYHILFFDIIDNNLDDDWVVSIEGYSDVGEDIWIYIESKELSNFSYEKFHDDDKESMNFLLNYLEKRNIVIVSNLAYCPHRHLQKYYRELLEKIDKLSCTECHATPYQNITPSKND